MKLRQAIEYGVNKVAVQKVLGGPCVAKVINTAIPPGAAGYQNYNPYPEQGRPGQSRQVQGSTRAGGQKSGIKLNMAYQNDSVIAAEFPGRPGQPQALRDQPGGAAGVRRHVLHPPRHAVGKQQVGHVGHRVGWLDS